MQILTPIILMDRDSELAASTEINTNAYIRWARSIRENTRRARAPLDLTDGNDDNQNEKCHCRISIQWVKQLTGAVRCYLSILHYCELQVGSHTFVTSEY